MKEHICPSCGETILCNAPRHNKRGQGAHYAGEMKKLSQTHKDVLEAIDEGHAIDFESGLTLSEVTYRVNVMRKPKPNLKDQTVAARLSELQGLRILSCLPAETMLVDKDTMRFENTGVPRWHRVSASLLEAVA